MSLNVFVVGTGGVGAELLDQLSERQDIKVLGIANSKRMYFNLTGVALSSWRDQLQKSPLEMNLSGFMKQMITAHKTHTVFVDCSSSDDVAALYLDCLQADISVVTPNKKANSGPFDRYEKLNQIVKNKKVRYYYDATVGAGLPILRTLKGLNLSHDTVHKIEGVLSGTLSFLFNNFDETRSFSTLVKNAQKSGYTEPDPRDDLSCMDVARKVVIMAREIGLTLELTDVQIDRILPEGCIAAATVDDFYTELEKHDRVMSDRAQQAASTGKRLRVIASIENAQAKISLQEVDSSHPFYHLSGTNNIVSISTRHYTSPLVIMGPGAGLALTASKVLEGIIRVAE